MKIMVTANGSRGSSLCFSLNTNTHCPSSRMFAQEPRSLTFYTAFAYLKTEPVNRVVNSDRFSGNGFADPLDFL